MPTYSHPKNMSSASQGPDRPSGKPFGVNFQRSPQQPMSKVELRAMAAQAFQNTAKMQRPQSNKRGGR